MLNSIELLAVYSASNNVKKLLSTEKWYLNFFEGKDIRILEILPEEQKENIKKVIGENIETVLQIMFDNNFTPHTFPEHPEITFYAENKSPNNIKCRLN